MACVTLVKLLTHPPQKIDMSIAEDDCGENVIVGIQQKRGPGKSANLHGKVGRFQYFGGHNW